MRAAANSIASGSESTRAADLGDDRFVELAGVEVGRRDVGPLDEQADRSVGTERGQRPDDLAGDTQRLTARRQHDQVGARIEELVHGLRRGVHDVLAVVEDERGAANRRSRR